METEDIVTRSFIEEVSKRIANTFNPLQIILFGSYARGEANQNSDIDLLVLIDSSSERRKVGVSILRMLAGFCAEPVDIIVRSKESFDQYRDVSGSFAAQVHSEGIVLYDRESH